MNVTTSSHTEGAVIPLVSTETVGQVLNIANAATLVFSILGVITNSINIRVFIRQGLVSESTTVSLFALAISDLLSCFFLVPNQACFYLDRYGHIGDVFLRNCNVLTRMTALYPHLVFSRVTCWVTVYLSLERALCVLLPLKIKTIFTPKKSVFAMSVIFVFVIVFHIPYAANTNIIWELDPSTNRSTIARSQDTALGSVLVKVNNMVFSLVLTIVAMVMVIIATLILFSRLKSSSKWRESLGSSTGSSSSSSKEKETIKIVSTITSVFVACTAVSLIPALAMFIVPGLSVSGVNQNLFYILYALKFLSDAINSSVNMFFYVRMSSKYRLQFFSIIGCGFCKTKK